MSNFAAPWYSDWVNILGFSFFQVSTTFWIYKFNLIFSGIRFRPCLLPHMQINSESGTHLALPFEWSDSAIFSGELHISGVFPLVTPQCMVETSNYLHLTELCYLSLYFPWCLVFLVAYSMITHQLSTSILKRGWMSSGKGGSFRRASISHL